MFIHYTKSNLEIIRICFESYCRSANWVIYDAINNELPDKLSDCDVYMATGSKHSVYEDQPWINALKELLRSIYASNIRFVGFCFGHQLIGEALGGKVKKAPGGWCVGVHNFKVTNKTEWMNPERDRLGLLMMCQDQVINLPKNAQVLASSDNCPNAMFTVGQNMLGIQAHPEFTKDYNQLLMETRMNKMGDEVALLGIQSLGNAIDPEVVRSWILHFIMK